MKKVERIGLVETNSSSSHSVSISNTGKVYLKDVKEFIGDDNIMRIPIRSDGDFGWGWERYNSFIQKLYYVCASFKYDKSYNKKMYSLKQLIMKFTGVNDVIFEWDSDTTMLPENRDIPSIDHQSTDIPEEILETKELLKDFLFNPESWLFIGNDNDEAPEGFYDVNKTNDSSDNYDAILRVNFESEDISGPMDFKIKEFPTIGYFCADEPYDSLFFNFKTNKLILGDYFDHDIKSILDTKYLVIDKNTNKYKLVFVNTNDVNTSYSNIDDRDFKFLSDLDIIKNKKVFDCEIIINKIGNNELHI